MYCVLDYKLYIGELKEVFSKNKTANAIKKLLIAIGEDPNREGLIDTPKRVAKFYEEWLEYNKEPKFTAFSATYSNMVIIKDIPFYSLCEHHLIPFTGKAHIGYIPNGKILGLSKIVRILNKYARRLQIQERLTDEIADELEKIASATGIMVVIEAEHLCMSMRGVRTPGAKTVTSAIRGAFEEDKVRGEFLKLINGR